MTPKKHDSKKQSELYEKIHNDEIEPTYGQISE
jgi:hypothetical protein